MMAEDLLSKNLTELKQMVSDMGEKPFRAVQLYHWLHVRCAGSFDEMTNLPVSFRQKLADGAPLGRAAVETVQVSQIDGTRKYLFRFGVNDYVESVLMRYEHGLSVCVSSQVGCRMGCRFCASTIDGLTRDLTAGEILSQVEQIQKDLSDEAGPKAGMQARVSHVVIMGTGEPLDNYDNVVRFIGLLTDENGLNLSQRNVTLSTCGLVPQIRSLAEEELAINLALSLHAPSDELRQTIMPIARRYSLKEVIPAMDAYYEKTGRRLTFEYALIRDVNDSDECVRGLTKLLKGKNALINLIPVNPVRERAFRETTKAETAAFKKKLEKNGLHVTIRREMGRYIDEACGQLMRLYRL